MAERVRLRPANEPVRLRRWTNPFGKAPDTDAVELVTVMQVPSLIERIGGPSGRPYETIDVRHLGPPEPLRLTLERLAELPDETVLVQRNDRAPRFLYPKLRDRGYAFETVKDVASVGDEETVTIIWRP